MDTLEQIFITTLWLVVLLAFYLTLFLQLLATMVTYLVVLLQFQISIPDATQPEIPTNIDDHVQNITDTTTEASSPISTSMSAFAK